MDISTMTGEGRKAASPENEEMDFVTFKSQWDPRVYVCVSVGV